MAFSTDSNFGRVMAADFDGMIWFNVEKKGGDCQIKTECVFLGQVAGHLIQTQLGPTFCDSDCYSLIHPNHISAHTLKKLTLFSDCAEEKEHRKNSAIPFVAAAWRLAWLRRRARSSFAHFHLCKSAAAQASSSLRGWCWLWSRVGWMGTGDWLGRPRTCNARGPSRPGHDGVRWTCVVNRRFH